MNNLSLIDDPVYEITACQSEARCRCASYFRALGVNDPVVLARMATFMVDRARDSLVDCQPLVSAPRLVLATMEAADRYVGELFAEVDRQLDELGGASRTGEIALWSIEIFQVHPAAIESSAALVELVRRELPTPMSANPIEKPVPFEPQPLTAGSGGFLRELIGSIAGAMWIRLPRLERSKA